MDKEWAPTWLGQRLTRSPGWHLRLDGLDLALTAGGRTHHVIVSDVGSYRIQRGVVWTSVAFFPGKKHEVKVDGLPNGQGAALGYALEWTLNEKRLREDVASLKLDRQKINAWLEHMALQEEACARGRCWITHEMQSAMEAARPQVDAKAVRALLKNPSVALGLGGAAKAVESALAAWEADRRPSWAALNAAHIQRELKLCKTLFDRVESKPLTEEQASAVICFDNRVQVVASAGSGKTSTMVAKAAYAIHRGFVEPENVVMLAFNKRAAEELKERAAKSFHRLGMEGTSVEATTFHALGLGIIGKATKEKPDIPDWATDPAGGVRKITEIVGQLKDRSKTFRTQWDLFLFVFGKSEDLALSPESKLVQTNDNHWVRSGEEREICNWLFYNGVNYRYEAQYEHHTATEDHRQYKPDFYYPDLGLYHEHFALNAQGEPPPHFAAYMDGVVWKRQLHRDHGTDFIETTSHGVRNGDDFQRLEAELTSRGVVLDPNIDREIPLGGIKPMDPRELIGLMRTFLSHAKSNCLTIPALRQRLEAMPEDSAKNRHRLFLDIAEPILAAWDTALAAEGGIDFEDMLNLAAEHLESGRYQAPYTLVMADEFQDASRARARLCRALVQQPGRFLFAVGDDWQSINRFAGADVSVMTGFQQWFGQGQVLKLEQTFRCSQALCDVSSAFISKNPAQIAKRVRSDVPAQGPVLQAFQVDDKDQLADAIDQFVVRLAERVRDGIVAPGRDGKVSVYVLGRYNADRQYVPARQSRFNRWVEVSFLTIHRSKGSEADYVILPEMVSVVRGRSFPNTRADDPVLALAMPEGETFPQGEERRLFYVALTRARRSVAMFAARGQCSSFLLELAAEGAVAITDMDGEAIREERCPACKQGVLVLRTGPYGEFRSCSNFPDCTYKPKKKGAPTQLEAQRLAQRTAQSIAPARPIPRSAPAPAAKPAAVKGSRWSLSSVLSAVADGIEDVSRNVDRAKAIQNATSSLEQDLKAERAVIENSLKSAEFQEQMQDNPRLRANYQELMAALANGSDDNDSGHICNPLPTFQRTQPHPDSDIEAAIAATFHRLREDREAFLSVVHARLDRDPKLRGHFFRALEDLNGAQYLAALDPSSSWSR